MNKDISNDINVNYRPKVEHNYVDITVSNPPNSTNDNIQAEFDVTYNDTILKDMDRYMMTVARMKVPAREIPLFWTNDTTYSITLSYFDVGGATEYFYQEFLVFPSPAETPIVGQPALKRVRIIQEFLDAINTAMQNALEAMTLGVYVTGLPVSYAPFYTWDNATQQIVLHVERPYNQLFAGNPAVVRAPQIWYNEALFHLFPVWEAEYPVNIPALSNGRALQVNIKDNGYNRDTFQYPLDNVGAQYLGAVVNSLSIFQSQGNLMNALSKIQNIVITSSSFGNRKQIQNRVSSAISGNFNNANYQTSGVVFDLAVDSSGESITEYFVYTPSLYRWIDLQTHNDNSRVEFKIFYLMDGIDYLFPLEIGIGNSMSIKFLFKTAENLRHVSGGIDISNRADKFKY